MRFSSRRWVARSLLGAGLALVLGATLSAAGLTLPAQAVTLQGVGDPTASAVTVPWDDSSRDHADANYNNFKNIVFTVNQTENLSHQGITVRWTGAPSSSALQFAQNFMQAMECWGDSPEQCQFGQPSTSLSDKSGFLVQSRSIEPGIDPVQAANMPDEYLLAENGDGSRTYAVPYISPDGSSTFDTAQLFSSATTNEVGAATTGSDGTGLMNFEVQTSLEAPHLGCGADQDGTPQPCYLIIVPRGTNDLNGQPAAESSGKINGSPLSASAWKNRVVIPLNFTPVSVSCPIGQAEVRIVGSEIVAKAVTSWQPMLCQHGSTYGFSRIGDDEARTQITGTELGASHMGIVTEPLTADKPYAAGIDYAPVAQSAVVVAYNIDYSLYSSSSMYGAKNGTKVHNLRLNQRLLAKLLTQSYREDTPGAGFGNAIVQANPRGLTVDPEFLQLNPDFRDFTRVYPQGIYVAFGNSDMNKHVWQWIVANADARNFLTGQADPWGMKVNPSYQALGLTTDVPPSFPKADLHTYTANSDIPAFGTLDMRPYYGSLDETATRALRADGNIKTAWDPFKLPAPGQYTAISPQPVGQRFTLAITDFASAYRYGLDVASLQGSVNGNFIAPTGASIVKAIGQRTASDAAGVSTPNFTKQVNDAYPLSEVSYAAVNVCAATPSERTAYSSFIDYVTSATAGQVSGDGLGQLPEGYVPLSTSQRSIAEKAMADIKNPLDTATRCAAPVTPQVSTPASTTFSITDSAGAVTKKKLFIRKAIYGNGETSDTMPVVSRILTAGGYILGIPMVVLGFLVLSRDRRRGITRL